MAREQTRSREILARAARVIPGSAPTPAGMRTSTLLSFLPASIRQTRFAGSADSRLASTQPALPAPTIT